MRECNKALEISAEWAEGKIESAESTNHALQATVEFKNDVLRRAQREWLSSAELQQAIAYTGTEPQEEGTRMAVSDAVRALVAKWRDKINIKPGSELDSARNYGFAYCADELESFAATHSGDLGFSLDQMIATDAGEDSHVRIYFKSSNAMHQWIRSVIGK